MKGHIDHCDLILVSYQRRRARGMLKTPDIEELIVTDCAMQRHKFKMSCHDLVD